MIQENYDALKKQYPKSIVMIKSGSFFECLDDDAIIINDIFGYKIKKFNNYIRVGFPASNLNKVKGILTNKEVNYVTLIDGDINAIKLKHNNYKKYNEKVINYRLAKEKIEYITNKLNNNLFNENIVYILNEMEKLLCKINY